VAWTKIIPAAIRGVLAKPAVCEEFDRSRSLPFAVPPGDMLWAAISY
jgi:hypothetical protein